jgi:hypothetical protein
MNKGLIFSMLLIAAIIVSGIVGGPVAAIIVAALSVAYGGLIGIYFLMKKHLH